MNIVHSILSYIIEISVIMGSVITTLLIPLSTMYIFYLTFFSKKILNSYTLSKNKFEGDEFSIHLENRTLRPILIRSVHIIYEGNYCLTLTPQNRVLKISPWDIETISTQYTNITYIDPQESSNSFKDVLNFNPFTSKIKDIFIQTTTICYNTKDVFFREVLWNPSDYTHLAKSSRSSFGAILNERIKTGIKIKNELWYLFEDGQLHSKESSGCKFMYIDPEKINTGEWIPELQKQLGHNEFTIG